VADVATLTTKITGTNATGATVVLAFGSSPAVPMSGFVTVLTATTWEYVVTSTDITNLGADGGQSVTATATLTGGATAAATRVFVLNAVNDAPLIAASAVGLVDTAAADTFTGQTGTLSAVDPDAGTTPTTLTYGINGGAAGATVGGVVYDVSKVGIYGTLYVKSTTGEYVFVANAAAINALNAGVSNQPPTTETFVVTASDGSLSGNNNLIVTITGANDTPVLVAPTAIALTDTAAADTFANQTGTLSASDAEGTALTYGITGSSAGATVGGIVYDISKVGTYGTLYVKSATGEYVFVANAAAIDAMGASTVNQPATTETFAITASDGTLTGANTLTVNLTGANDTPVVVTPTAIALVDTAAVDTFTNQTGTLAAADADNTSLTYGITGSTAGATVGGVVYDVRKVGTYGTLYVKATGEYVYVANATAVNGTSADQTESFTVTASDGVGSGSSTLTINVTSANDAPINTVSSPIVVAEDVATAVTGLSISDADAGTADVTVTLSALHGLITVTAATGVVVTGNASGSVVLTGTVSAINAALAATSGVTYVGTANYNGADTLTMLTSDLGSTGAGGVKTDSDTVSISVTAVNDAPTASGTVPNQTAVVSQPYTSLDLSTYFADVDAGDTRTYSITGALPTGLSLNATTGVISSTSGATANLADDSVTVTMTDSGGLTATRSFNFQAVTAPVVTHFSVADASGVTTTGKLGETVSVVLTFTEPVDVVGAPTITLYMNGAPVTGTYVSADAIAKTLTFTATLPAGDGTAISLTSINTSVGNTFEGNTSHQPWTIVTGASTTGYTVDNTASTAPTLTSVTDDVTAVTGVVSAGGTTNDTAPTVRVTLATTGANAVVAGDTVQLYNSTTALGSVVALSDADVSIGYVDITPTGLTNGTTYSLNAKVTDVAGNTSVASGSYAVTIDTAAPVISAVAFGTTTGALKVGDTLTATITADQATYTAGAITVNGKATTGFTNNGNSTYTVTYTVVQGDIDVLDTAAIPVSVVLVDAAGNSNAAYTTAPVFGSAPAVDAHVPTITNVVITATGAQNNTLNATDVITATVTFNESVTATAGSTLGILVGSATRLATVTAATGTTLTYTYTVAAGDVDADGISVPAGGFTLNAGTIKDAAGNNAALTYTAVAAQAGYKVDTASPIITSSYSVNENTLADAVAKSVTLATTNETGAVTWSALAGTDAASFTLGTGADLGKLLFAGVSDFETKSSYSVTLTGTDAAGNATTAQVVTVNINNVNEAPTVSAAIADATVLRGSAMTSINTATAFTDPDSLASGFGTLSYSIIGTPPAGLSIDSVTGVITGTPTVSGNYNVQVQATDGTNLVSDTFALSVVTAPVLAATQTLDGVTNLDVRSALVIAFDGAVSLNSTGVQHIKILDDMNAAGWNHTASSSVLNNTIVDTYNNDVDITMTNGVATLITLGGVDYTSRFNLSTSVVVNGNNLVIDLKPAVEANYLTVAAVSPASTAFDWDFGANYHVELDAGVVTRGGVGNAALADSTTLNFTTVTPVLTTAGAVASQIMDATGAVTTLSDSYKYLNGNQGNSQATPYGATLDLSGGKYAVVLDSDGTNKSNLGGWIRLQNFSLDNAALNQTDLIYMDNHGNQALLTTNSLSVSNPSTWGNDTVITTDSIRKLNAAAGGAAMWVTLETPAVSGWTKPTNDATFENATHMNYDAIIFG
jgi:hypothetical protein